MGKAVENMYQGAFLLSIVSTLQTSLMFHRAEASYMSVLKYQYTTIP